MIGNDAEFAQEPSGRKMETFTKSELVAKVSAVAEITFKDAEVLVETILNAMVRALHAGDNVEIRGFGSFRTRPRRARTGRNPKTGARVDVPAKNIPYFTPSKELKDALKNLTPAGPK
jgi:integration host factor subunit beta